MDKKLLIEKKNILNKEIEILEQEIDVIRKDMNAIRDEIAKLNCPYKIGEIIYNKKTGKKCRIVEITAQYDDDDYRLMVHVFLKNDKESGHTSMLWAYGWDLERMGTNNA